MKDIRKIVTFYVIGLQSYFLNSRDSVNIELN